MLWTAGKACVTKSRTRSSDGPERYLEFLDVRFTMVTDFGIDDLRQMLPKVKFFQSSPVLNSETWMNSPWIELINGMSSI